MSQLFVLYDPADPNQLFITALCRNCYLCPVGADLTTLPVNQSSGPTLINLTSGAVDIAASLFSRVVTDVEECISLLTNTLSIGIIELTAWQSVLDGSYRNTVKGFQLLGIDVATWTTHVNNYEYLNDCTVIGKHSDKLIKLRG
jgi:hypothetical protein